MKQFSHHLEQISVNISPLVQKCQKRKMLRSVNVLLLNDIVLDFWLDKELEGHVIDYNK